MSKSELAAVEPRSLAKGLIAGLIGGLVGTVAQAFAERMFSPRPAHRNSEPADAGIHWGFGLAVGAAYGAVAEYFPAATSKDGAGFGMVLGSLTGEAAPPAPGAVEQDNQAGEITSYVAYGVTTEFVRSFVRKRL